VLLKECVSWAKILLISAVILFPKAKINLGLRILGRRPDGFHHISSLMLPLPLQDALEFMPGGISFQIEVSGLIPEGDPEDNLVIRAARLMQEQFGIGGGAIWLHKAIPSGAGLGGGSSDASAMLRLLQKAYALRISSERMHSLALSLGSDCPFFLQESACWVSGIGDGLTPARLPGKAYYIILIKPGTGISTALAYRSIRQYSAQAYEASSALPPEAEWEHFFRNDFQEWACQVQPEIGNWIAYLKEKGAFYAAMSGSGSCVFGLFQDGYPDIRPGPGVFVWKGRIRI